MIYRLLAINIDGTLLQPKGKLHRATKEAINYVQEKGIYVTLVTSRNFLSAKKVANALKLDNILITHSGAFIADNIDEPIVEKRIPSEISYEIIRLLEGANCQVRIFHERFCLINKPKFLDNLLAKVVFNTNDPLFYPQQYVDSISETINQEPVDIPLIEVFFNEENDLFDLREAIRRMYSEVNIIQLSPQKLHIVPLGGSKANGLLHLGKHLGISRKEMVAIGDAFDDIDMIELAGLGVAMGNSPVEVKKRANWITRSNLQQGVAFMIREHFRKQQPIEFLRKMNIIK